MSPLITPTTLAGLSAVVTGGSRGLGLLLAERLAAVPVRAALSPICAIRGPSGRGR